MKLFLSSVLLAFVFHAAPSGAQERPAVRPIPIPFRENGYSNFESQAFNTKAEFDAFIAGTANQIGWNNRQAFVEALQKANVDFAHEAVVILRHTESSGSVRVAFAPLTPNTRKLICWMRGSVLAGAGTMDMAYYGKALVVSRAAVSEVEFRDVLGGLKERELPPVIFQITAETSPDQTPRPAEKANSAITCKRPGWATICRIICCGRNISSRSAEVSWVSREPAPATNRHWTTSCTRIDLLGRVLASA